MIAIKSILNDERINAYNVLVEINVGEYLKFARNIIDNNEFQRKKVIKSKKTNAKKMYMTVFKSSQKNIDEHLKLYAGYVKHTNLIQEKIEELKCI